MMETTKFLPLARRVLRRDWEVFLFVAIGSLLLVSLQLIGDMPSSQDQYPLARQLVEILDMLRSKVMPVLHPLSLFATTCYLLLPLPIKLRRSIVDIFAV
jgi:hypothetical protein